ncbi:hypothetical protein AMEX_G28077 [Astyanax mexicanus]|uniref:Uncharacterized protein n=1 Tax=Astyanax mexicanus TaxID=7994 RepID=A0A8T2KHV0_ASTMX|nr:hypothetical protein AMEX_G28077 [Astyanax mexicanus]
MSAESGGLLLQLLHQSPRWLIVTDCPIDRGKVAASLHREIITETPSPSMVTSFRGMSSPDPTFRKLAETTFPESVVYPSLVKSLASCRVMTSDGGYIVSLANLTKSSGTLSAAVRKTPDPCAINSFVKGCSSFIKAFFTMYVSPSLNLLDCSSLRGTRKIFDVSQKAPIIVFFLDVI